MGQQFISLYYLLDALIYETALFNTIDWEADFRVYMSKENISSWLKQETIWDTFKTNVLESTYIYEVHLDEKALNWKDWMTYVVYNDDVISHIKEWMDDLDLESVEPSWNKDTNFSRWPTS